MNDGGGAIKRVRQFTLTDAIRVIKSKGYNIETEKKLLKAVSKYPTGSYKRFIKDLQRHLRNAETEI